MAGSGKKAKVTHKLGSWNWFLLQFLSRVSGLSLVEYIMSQWLCGLHGKMCFLLILTSWIPWIIDLYFTLFMQASFGLVSAFGGSGMQCGHQCGVWTHFCDRHNVWYGHDPSCSVQVDGLLLALCVHFASIFKHDNGCNWS